MSSYQNQYEPDSVSAPGETLVELLSELDMSQAELAERTGRPKQLISDIATGRKQITPETALQFEKALGVSASFWNSREALYRGSIERAEEGARLADQVDWLKNFPVRKMINHGWLKDANGKLAQLRELLAYFGVASPERWEHLWSKRELAFRKSEAFNVDVHALSVWLRRGEIQARAITTAPFSATAFGESLRRLRALTCEPDPAVFIPSLRETCASAGVAVVFVPELPGCRASGVTQWLTSDKALIQLSLRYKADDHLWFTFFHEAGHILKHGKRKIFVELGSASDTEMEREADRFSADWLIPRADLNQFAQQKPFSKDRIVRFARTIGISPGIVVGRLQHEGWLPRTHCNDLKARFEWRLPTG